MEAVVRRRVAQVSQHCRCPTFDHQPKIYKLYQVIAADEGGGHGRSNESLLAGAMAMALAHVNRQQAAAPAGSKVIISSKKSTVRINSFLPTDLQYAITF